ncbi:MAG TPA: VWA domain-containing protein [Fibrobacteria bacterium]|nr:VWA domain-containing protein [Fibrobacteria bacterium]
MIPHFHSPWFLLGLLFIPFLVWDYFHKNRQRKASIRFPTLAIVKRVPENWAYRARHILLVLRILTLSLLCVALARPQYGEALEDVTTQGVDIVMVLDLSTSMKIMDFKPQNRLYVAKREIEKFILGRRHDRIGLVVFAGKAFTQCPLTLDYGVLVQFLRKVDFGLMEDGTAIGTGILTATNRLRGSTAKSKVMVVLTDGENNAGEVDPITAAKAAAALGIKIYTIGVGKQGEQPMEMEDPLFGKRIVSVPTKIDEPMMRTISSLTGGQYWRAQDPKGLEEIYGNIDQLEKTEIKSSSYYRYHELFRNFVLAALLFLLLEIGLANTRFMKIP